MSWEEYMALPPDERRWRAMDADRYRRSGRYAPGVKPLRALIIDGLAECARCTSMERLAVDHIYPVVLGGTHEPANLQILCKRCNSSKKART